MRPTRVDAARALGWRLGRQALGAPLGSVAEVVHRVVAMRAWPADLADLAVRVRQSDPRPGGLERALGDGELVRSYAFRGGSYVFTHAHAADLLAVRTATRIWETRRWQRQGGFEVDDWEPLRDAVRTALADGPLTRAEIAARLEGTPGVRQLAAAAASGAGADSLYKPLHWWGDICFGPARDGRATFRRLADDPRWPGLPDVDDAGRRAVLGYLGGYGPATLDNLGYWLTEGLGVPRRRVLDWLADLGDTVTEVEVDGAARYLRTDDLEQVCSAEPSAAVRLLPGFDPWVFGPGTADAGIISVRRRPLASRGSNLVIAGGVVSGSWRLRTDELAVTWFDEAGRVPESRLADEVRRLAALRGADLRLAIDPPLAPVGLAGR